MEQPAPPPDETALRARLGDALVDDFLFAAEAVGQAYLPGDEDLVFGFVQRMLARLKQEGRNRGLLFPKFDADYNRLFDYFDPDGTIWVIRAAQVPCQPGWFVDHDAGDPERAYFGLTPGASTAIAHAFLAALAALKARGATA